jgi:hypothetical protein
MDKEILHEMLEHVKDIAFVDKPCDMCLKKDKEDKC